MGKFCIYETVTNQILEKLEEGNIPWKKPWGNIETTPKNLITNKEYSGINLFLLAMRNYNSSYWATAKQIKDVGGNIIKGQKASMIIFWKMLEQKKEDGKIEKIPLLKYYNVFNIEQCENIDNKRLREEQEKIKEIATLNFKPIESAEAILNNFTTAPVINYAGNKASYSKSIDYISMPQKEFFTNEEEFYSTLFHELAHSTGHEKRLNRSTLTEFAAFGDENYSQEELVAEFCSSFLCHKAEISNVTLDNSTAYIKGWSSFLKKNPKALIQASTQAKRASEYILNNGASNG